MDRGPERVNHYRNANGRVMSAFPSTAFRIGTHALQQILNSHAARSILMSISLRRSPKSIGLVSSTSAPFSKALGLVSASP
jgi:hypothetical protein